MFPSLALLLRSLEPDRPDVLRDAARMCSIGIFLAKHTRSYHSSLMSIDFPLTDLREDLNNSLSGLRTSFKE